MSPNHIYRKRPDIFVKHGKKLYFNIGYPAADFNVLAKWWRDYSAGTPVYGGLGTYRLDANSKIEAWRSAQEIKKQAEILRTMEQYHGVCYFSAKDMRKNVLGINTVLKGLYPAPSIVPALRGFETTPPAAPAKAEMTLAGGKLNLSWSGDKLPEGNASLAECNSERAYYYAVYRFKKGETPDFENGKAMISLTGETSFVTSGADASHYEYYVSALDRLYNESTPVKFK